MAFRSAILFHLSAANTNIAYIKLVIKWLGTSLDNVGDWHTGTQKLNIYITK